MKTNTSNRSQIQDMNAFFLYMVKKLDIEESKVLEMCVQLYKHYGTTMAGLRAIGYDSDHDDYHSFVHGRLPYEYLKPDPVLKSLLNSLPIRKVIFSNANEAHVEEVLGRLGLGDCFDDVICFESLNSKTQTANTSKCDNEPVGLLPKSPIACKPSENAFQQAFKMANINPHKTLFFDNSIHNIQTAKLTGLTTVGSSQRKNGVDYALQSVGKTTGHHPPLIRVTSLPIMCWNSETILGHESYLNLGKRLMRMI
ncbi:putative pyridoxal phosphatase [Helianthus annuus]|nr:putative pyridoxal phosphatase [Helianthus annuus]